VDRLQLPPTGAIDQRLQRFVEQIRESSGAQAVFIADAEGLELAATGANPAHIALLGEFAGVRRRIAKTTTTKRPPAMSVALSESEWLQVLWLDEDTMSPALAVVQTDLLSPEVASKLRALTQTILGNLR
jgi:hypothetical protein